LGSENKNAAKSQLLVTQADFYSVLQQTPALVQRLCTIYIQDYLCLGYALPKECEGGDEFGWVSGAARVGEL